MIAAPTRHVEIDTRYLRGPAFGMLAAGVLLPILGHPGAACPLRTLTGIPCPLCGASTSVEAAVRGHVVTALKTNPLGVIAVAIAAFAVATRRTYVWRVPLWAVAVALGGAWLVELVRFKPF
ncbi:MAG: DUF2752 domain-containing protein [Actinomycetota bacterium]|nr:DUF2752 domain-containing protein [Actinomycetota bacterium]